MSSSLMTKELYSTDNTAWSCGTLKISRLDCIDISLIRPDPHFARFYLDCQARYLATTDTMDPTCSDGNRQG